MGQHSGRGFFALEGDVDDHCDNLHEALVHAARLRAVELMRARGYMDFFVLSDEARVFRRLGWAARDAVPENDIHHLFYGAGEGEGVFVRIGGRLPEWWPFRASIHVEADGTVMVMGPARGEFLQALAECIQSAVTAVLSARLLPAAG
jgi:hypothetical protein